LRKLTNAINCGAKYFASPCPFDKLRAGRHRTKFKLLIPKAAMSFLISYEVKNRYEPQVETTYLVRDKSDGSDISDRSDKKTHAINHGAKYFRHRSSDG
jgi:hypothetical protein